MDERLGHLEADVSASHHEGVVRSRATNSFALRSIRSTSVFTRTSRPKRARRLSGV
jgi:hypothetical protein